MKLGPRLSAAGWLLSGVAWASPRPAVASPEATTEAPAIAETVEPAAMHTEIRRAILRVSGLPWEEVRDALQPRRPGLEILPFDDAAFEAAGGELFAYVEIAVEPGPEGDVQLTIVLSDRRAYLRSITPDPTRPLRSIATTIANTLVAIEQERIEADQERAAIPRPEPVVAPAEPEAPVEPPARPVPVEPVVATPPVVEPETPAPFEPAPFELGLTAALHPTFGLAPAAVRGFAALGGEGRVSFRQRRGLVVELGLRGGGRQREGLRLWRNRLQLAAGYGWRGQRLAVTAVAGPTAEPWVVRRDRSRAATTPVGTSRASPLWGAAAAVTPALRFEVAPTVALQLGLRTELAVSALGSGASARVLASRPSSPPAPIPAVLFTLGGVELSTALELTVWIAPPRAR